MNSVTPRGPQASMRVRVRDMVRTEIATIALDLFLTQGFDETTVDQIVQAAGTSRATFFRYFRTKEDVVLGLTGDFAEQSRELLCSRPASEPIWNALRRALEPAIRQYGNDVEAAVRTARMMLRSNAIRARNYERGRQWQEALLSEVSRRMSRGEAQFDPGPAAILASALGCLDAAIEAWAQSDGHGSLAGLLDTAMSAVHPL